MIHTGRNNCSGSSSNGEIGSSLHDMYVCSCSSCSRDTRAERVEISKTSVKRVFSDKGT